MRWQRDFSRIWLIRSSPGRFCEPGRILAAVTACLLRCRRASPTLRGYMGLRWAPATQGTSLAGVWRRSIPPRPHRKSIKP
jgi:hypothetical protein